MSRFTPFPVFVLANQLLEADLFCIQTWLVSKLTTNSPQDMKHVMSSNYWVISLNVGLTWTSQGQVSKHRQLTLATLPISFSSQHLSLFHPVSGLIELSHQSKGQVKTNTEKKRKPISRIPQLCYQMRNMPSRARLYKIHSEPANLPTMWLSYENVHTSPTIALRFFWLWILALYIIKLYMSCVLLDLPNKQPVK